jgi:hypothetical protein
MNHVFSRDVLFRWQGSYGAIAVAYESVDRVSSYIRNQAVHHADGSLIAELERKMADPPAQRVARRSTRPVR